MIHVNLGNGNHEWITEEEYVKRGTYCVMIPELGHVESGLGVHGMVYPWEEVEGWNAAKEEEVPA